MRKKLIEVALPLEAINAAAAREKSIRHGHPSTLHLWWARRPLAACRAVLFASLVDDPDSDPAYRRLDGSVDEDRASAKRAKLFNLIAELVRWESSNDMRVINAARAEIAVSVASRKLELGELKKDTIVFGTHKGQAHTKGPVSGEGVTAWEVMIGSTRPEVVNAFLAEHAPPVLDPFCGGGSIPLEAQRLGLRAYASDLNPVPVLITKALIEIPPKFAGRPPVNPEARKKKLVAWPGATGLADDVRYYGKWMRDEAEKRIGHLYPKVKITEEMARERPDLKEYVGEELTVIAWLWARTVASPNPAANGAHVPLIRSFWLSTKKGKQTWVEPVVDRETMTYRFEIHTGDGEPRKPTVSRTGGTCLLTGAPIPLSYIRAEGKAGRIGERLMGIVAVGTNGRVFFPPDLEHARIAQSAEPRDVPDTNLPKEALGFRVQNYGMTRHCHLFSQRQLAALTVFSDLVTEAHAKVFQDSNRHQTYSDAVVTYLALALGKSADYWTSLASWQPDPKNLRVGHLFTRHAIAMTWDFGESNPFGETTANFPDTIKWIGKAMERLPASPQGEAWQANAANIRVNESTVFCTDPPYYDNVPYADLSDFFYVWLRRSLRNFYPELLETVLVPKTEELVAEPFRHGGRDEARMFFEHGIGQVFQRMRDVSDPSLPTTIFYAFKQAETDEASDDDEIAIARSSTGWETFLQGLTDAGWQIAGTWPMRTELGNRLRSMGSNALASSIVLVCRPRPEKASLATRKEFLTALRKELPNALRDLQLSNIAPVDLAQAAIGPGMAVFTRYARVLEAGDKTMSVRTALGLINQALDEVLAEQEGDFDPATRWAVAWFEQRGFEDGPFGEADVLSRAKNTAVNALVEAGLVIARSGKVRLRKRSELSEGWDPADARCPVWEVTQRLVHTLENSGEAAAAALLPDLGGRADTARELAYRLYTVCERKKWAEEALAYNGLVIAWPDLVKLAQSAPPAPPTQHEMNFEKEGS